METRKLYYEDCMCRKFSTKVLECRAVEKGWQVILDATAFYPEGGGQACDLGTLGGVRVLDVREKGEEIIHLCDGPLEVESAVEGEIDWDRRWDLMQQHTGEHIVSGLIHSRFGYHNVGFHMGADVITIDFDGPIPQEALAEIEKEANRRVWEDRAVRCWYPERSVLPNVPYRTKKQLPWPVRIVEISGTDLCACCGVHVATTGQVGLIKLFSCVKFHQGVRIEMACGGRALEFLSLVYEQNRQVSQAFSAKILETGAAARKMNENLADEKYRASQLQKQILRIQAQSYAGKGNVVHFAEDLAPGNLRNLAQEIAECSGGVAAVLCEAGDTWNVCLANPGGDVKELGTRMAKALNGCGGGKAGFFQGSLKASREEILAFFAGF